MDSKIINAKYFISDAKIIKAMNITLIICFFIVIFGAYFMVRDDEESGLMTTYEIFDPEEDDYDDM
jgi:hypothetical protein